MYTTTYSYNSTTPTAHVTVRKNRVKQYGVSPTKVYLKDNQEFEVELFNPKTTPVMAKIKLNGQYISTKGIYLKPGQRIFLDRFIDSPKKLMFSTYTVEANDVAVAKAIAYNGYLEVEFYDEVIKYNVEPFWLNTPTTTTWGTAVPTMDMFTTSTFTTNSVNCFHSNSTIGGLNQLQVRSKSMETGRVEAGASSNQKFNETYGDFNSFYSTLVSYKILPDSQEPVTIQQVVTTNNFCGGCGTKIAKPHYKFCPSCGEKLQ